MDRDRGEDLKGGIVGHVHCGQSLRFEVPASDPAAVALPLLQSVPFEAPVSVAADILLQLPDVSFLIRNCTGGLIR